MTTSPRTRSRAHTHARAAAFLVPLLAAAILSPLTRPTDAAAQNARTAEPPTETELTHQPRLRNGAQAAKALYAAYPELLRAAGIEGVTKVWIRVDDQGRVVDARPHTTSGYLAMDEAAVEVAKVMSFEPGRQGNRVVPAWIVMNIRFALPAEEGETTTPPASPPATPAPAPQPEPAPAWPSIAELMEGPVELAVETEPRTTNAAQVASALKAFHPAELLEAGIGGAATLWILIDAAGAVIGTRIRESSGHAALDDAAATVGRTMRFTPARTGGEAVAVWRPISLRFEVPAEEEPEPEAPVVEEPIEEEPVEQPIAEAADTPADSAVDEFAISAPGAAPPVTEEVGTIAPPPAREPELGDEPTFTPMTVRPTLLNQAEVGQALAEHYPPLLRDAGIGGTVNVWFFIDEEGTVVNAKINESSGYDAFDRAALQVARTMRFTPGQNRDKAVPVWIALDITFTAQ